VDMRFHEFLNHLPALELWSCSDWQTYVSQGAVNTGYT
jgi:hypothetical protein